MGKNNKNFNSNNINNIYSLDNPDIYRDIILLFCPSKVGSTSIASSIRTFASDKYIVLHSHKSNILELTGQDDIKYKLTYQDIIKNNQIINKINGKQRKIFVIDIFRSPVERKISEFFQYIGEYHFNNHEDNIVNYDISKIIKRFNNLFEHYEDKDYYNEEFGINPIEKFDFEKKYCIEKIDNVTWIKLRLDDSDYWGEILTELLGTKIKMIKDYSTNQKIIGPLYKRFLSEYKLPINYFFKLLVPNKQLNIYYNLEDRTNYLSKWKNRLDKNFIGYTKEQFLFYKELCIENKYIKNNENNHYTDDGCICNICKQKRSKLINQINLGISYTNNYNINHKIDKTYVGVIFLRIYSKSPDGILLDKSDDIIINYYALF